VINVADFLGTVGDPARISTTFDGFDAGAITTSANVELADGSTLELRGAIANTGNIGLNSTGDATQLVINSLTSVTLSGNGKVTLSDNANNAIVSDGAGGQLVNAGNTISGAGLIGIAGATNATAFGLTNQGAIDADAQGLTLQVFTGETVTNSGLMEATAGGDLIINDNVQNSDPTSNVPGTIEAVGAGSVVQFGGISFSGGQFVSSTAEIFDGTVEAVAGGLIVDPFHSQFETTTLEAFGGKTGTVGGLKVELPGGTIDLYGSDIIDCTLATTGIPGTALSAPALRRRLCSRPPAPRPIRAAR
jgi:hypothetical protein